MKRFAAILFFGFLSFNVTAQTNGREKIYSTSSNTLVKGLVRTYDGGYAIAGSVDSSGFGSFDFFLLKLDASLQFQWAYRYGSMGDETCFHLRQTADSGFVLSGYSTGFGNGSKDAYIVKTDGDGLIQWSRLIKGSLEDRFTWCEPRSDGTMVCAGNTKSAGAGDDDMLMVKFDANGDTIWTRIFGGPVYDAGICIANLSNGGYAMSGRVFSFGNGLRDACLLTTDVNGNLQWFRTYGGPYTDEGMVVKQTTDGGFLISGASESFSPSGYYDVYTVRTDSLGSLLWSRCYGGNNTDATYDFIENADGGFTIIGFSESFNSNVASGYYPDLPGNDSASVFLIRTNAQGDTLWTRIFGGNKFDEAYAIIPSDSGGFVMGAFSRSFNPFSRYDVYLLWTDSAGISSCNTKLPPAYVLLPNTVPMIHAPSVNSGISVNTPFTSVAALFYQPSDPCSLISVVEQPEQTPHFSIFPNPASGSLYLEFYDPMDMPVVIRLFDVTGQLILSESVSPHKMVVLPVGFLQSGVYFMEVWSRQSSVRKKFVKTEE